MAVLHYKVEARLREVVWMIGKCGLTSRETDDKIKLSEVFANGLPQSLRKAPSDMQSFESFRDEEFAAAKALSSTENVPTGKLRRRQRNGMVIARDKIGFRDFCAYKNRYKEVK